MESIDQDRWARLVDAARRVNGGSGPAAENEAVRVEIERSKKSGATSRSNSLRPMI